jgi:phosphopantothenoylcysteine decarboxylase/phosphopantothenate--cysteine ligase
VGEPDPPPEVLLGVTGGIAAYRAAELVRLLVRDSIAVQVVMTTAAQRFVGAQTFAGLSRRRVLTDEVSADGPIYPHLVAARGALVMCVAPCSANTLAKLAAGIADNVLCESALALGGRLVVAPAMNVGMWEHPATQANVATLAARGAVLVGPDSGELAEGESGAGRLAQPHAIRDAIRGLLPAAVAARAGSGRPASALEGRRVLVTAGGTREPLDPVRFIGNRSSGRMGVALADEALARGADVTTLLCNAAVRPRGGEVVETPTAAALADAVAQRAPAADVVLMAAAVADYTPRSAAAEKRPRADAFTLELVPTADILAAVGRDRRPGQVLVGFAAETGDGLARAREKRARKGVDLIVLNDVARPDIGFDVAENEVVIVGADVEEAVPRASKRAVAAAILDRVERCLGR